MHGFQIHQWLQDQHSGIPSHTVPLITLCPHLSERPRRAAAFLLPHHPALPTPRGLSEHPKAPFTLPFKHEAPAHKKRTLSLKRLVCALWPVLNTLHSAARPPSPATVYLSAAFQHNPTKSQI